MEEIRVERHDTDQGGRYSVSMPDGSEARLTFTRPSASHWIADHTFVPVPWRERGIAERMVERLIADARAAGVRITPACWFVAAEFERMSPAWDDVLMR